MRISAYCLNTVKLADDMMASAKSGGQRIQYLPKKYNEKSELRLAVDGNEATLRWDCIAMVDLLVSACVCQKRISTRDSLVREIKSDADTNEPR